MIGSTANNHQAKVGISTVRRASGAYSDIDTSPQGDLAPRYNHLAIAPIGKVPILRVVVRPLLEDKASWRPSLSVISGTLRL
jgi:hypothetical protein